MKVNNSFPKPLKSPLRGRIGEQGRLYKVQALCLGMLLLALFSSSCLMGADSPDDLYAKGRYKEAEQAYLKLGMDRPSDLKPRYNRGCAAFQSGDLDAAKASFESTLRRSKADDMSFRSLYNLGNTAFMQNDFQGAGDYYRQALKLRPGDEDTMHNLELALKALKKQQETGNDQSRDEQGKDSNKEEKDDPEASGGDGQKDGSRDGNEQGSQAEDRGTKDPQEQNNQQPSGDQGENPQDRAGDKDGQGVGQDERPNLAGELKGRNTAPGAGAQGEARQEAAHAAMMERQKAEALLDNINEDRSRLNEFQGIQGGRRLSGSGKEW